jgi:Mn2+/Fe2+ NRAMP family transporter
MANINAEIKKIKERNKRVEADKAWETSNMRRAVITISIYLLAVIIFKSINAPDPLINAVIPALGFFLSTMTFPFLKDWWIKSMYKKE